MIKGSIQEDITIVNIYEPNIEALDIQGNFWQPWKEKSTATH